MSQSTTSDARASGPPPRGRGRRVLAGLAAAAVAAGTGVFLPGTASAAVPVFPDNITIFPDRDFVSIDGFVGNAGKPITIEVVRGGTVIGSATGTEASADVINAGNPAIEVNHPGGICWGAGGGINATPDIQPGDQLVVKIGGTAVADATTLSPKVTGHTLDPAGTTLTVTGTFGPDVDPTFLEQRIINPDLRPTDVNFRDVRAVPGPSTPDRRSPQAYSSGMDVGAGTFTATYVFANAATAKIADAGAMRSMSWQNLDANANRQGVTIQEDGELGGPGFGGCPAAAAAQGPGSPTAVKAVDNGNNTTTVNWTAPTVTPGTSPIVGYTVRAVTQTAGPAGGQDEIGKRIGDPKATTATLPTSLAGKTVEVRSYTTAGESWPPAVANKTGTPGSPTPTDTTVPTITVAPPGGSFTGPVTNVTLTASEPSSIVYTLDGSDPLIAASENPNAINYAGPFTISDKDVNNAPVAKVTLRYVAIDAGFNPSLAHTDVYTFGAATGPAAPTINKTTAGNGTIDVTWTAPANTGTSPITGYKLTATAQGAAAPAASLAPLSSATTATLTGLTNGTTYTVSLLATNATGDGTAATATVVVAANPTEVLTAGAPVNKTGDFRVKGTSSAAAGSVSLFNTDAAGNQTGAVLATSPLTAAVAPATGSTYDLRARTTIPAGRKLIIVGSNGGKLTITS